MFYLKEALRLKGLSYIVLIVWILSAIAMVASLGHADKIGKMIDVAPTKTISLPFFYALIDSDRPYERAMRKLRELPGVSLVSEVPAKELEKSLKETLKSAGLELGDLLKGPSVAGVKVVFNKNLAAEGQNLIRDYLTRLIGESYVTLGPVSTPDAGLFSATSGLEKYKIYFPWMTLALSSLVWIWALSLLLKDWKGRAYILEHYQRRSGVLAKMIVSVTAPLILFAFLINIWFAPLEMMALASLAIFGLVLSLSLWRGGQWEVA